MDSAGTSTYKRDGAGVTAPVLGDGAAVYTPGISERRSSTTTFLHSGLKNSDSQTGTGQTIGASRQYDAFGNVSSSTGTWKGPFGYAGGFGYQEDADSSLKLLGHRYYDPSTGRFLSRDPIKDGRNWYVYCNSNPVTKFDNAGLKEWELPVTFGGPGYWGSDPDTDNDPVSDKTIIVKPTPDGGGTVTVGNDQVSGTVVIAPGGQISGGTIEVKDGPIHGGISSGRGGHHGHLGGRVGGRGGPEISIGTGRGGYPGRIKWPIIFPGGFPGSIEGGPTEKGWWELIIIFKF